MIMWNKYLGNNLIAYYDDAVLIFNDEITPNNANYEFYQNLLEFLRVFLNNAKYTGYVAFTLTMIPLC